VTVLTAKPTAPATTVVEKQPAAAVKPSLLVAPRIDRAALFDATPLGLPRTFTQSAPLRAALVRPQPRQFAQAPAAQPPQPVAAAVPLPAPRPRDIEPTRNPTLQAAAQRGKFALASAESTPVAPSMFEKLFGKHETTGSTGASGSALA